MNNEQRGVALLIVLMLLALMAALAADMTLSFHSQLQRTRQVNHHLQRQYDIELAEKLALASLTQDVKDNDRQTTLQQYWAQPQQLQLEDGNTVKWQLRDAQHCFNLNALAKISDDPLASPDFPAQVFSALLINAGIDRGNTDEIVQSIADYIDVDDSPRFHGAEDSFYQSQTPPRHSANQMLFLTGELRQIKGITENIYQRLIPYVCVLPTTELSINLNMLTENDIPLFRALFLNNITDADARVLLQKRPREGWEMIKSWWAEKSTSEKQIVAALAVLSLGVFCWLGVIKPIDTYIAEHQSHAQKIKKDIKWMQDQASTHGLLGHPALTQPIKNILLEEAKRENLAITLENGPDNTLTIHPVTAPLENVSRWLTTAQVTYGIVIEDLQFTLAGNEEITLRHLSFREQQ
ncbi:type II secretion system minor pseudopilin GspK [Escherichia coli]|nr:type II secretion system minor pseudopilin GspK [Escherichia coli]OKW51038.1 hypothetical protein AWP79_06955 [Escherichia coli]